MVGHASAQTTPIDRVSFLSRKDADRRGNWIRDRSPPSRRSWNLPVLARPAILHGLILFRLRFMESKARQSSSFSTLHRIPGSPCTHLSFCLSLPPLFISLYIPDPIRAPKLTKNSRSISPSFHFCYLIYLIITNNSLVIYSVLKFSIIDQNCSIWFNCFISVLSYYLSFSNSQNSTN